MKRGISHVIRWKNVSNTHVFQTNNMGVNMIRYFLMLIIERKLIWNSTKTNNKTFSFYFMQET